MDLDVVFAPAEREELRALLKQQRERHRLISHAYGLMYDALTWTKTDLTMAMVKTIHDLVLDLSSPEFGSNGLVSIRKRLLLAGFRVAPEVKDDD